MNLGMPARIGVRVAIAAGGGKRPRKPGFGHILARRLQQWGVKRGNGRFTSAPEVSDETTGIARMAFDRGRAEAAERFSQQARTLWSLAQAASCAALPNLKHTA